MAYVRLTMSPVQPAGAIDPMTSTPARVEGQLPRFAEKAQQSRILNEIGTSGESKAVDRYIGKDSHIEALLERSSAASLAFLAFAAARAAAPPLDPSILCASGTHYEPTRGCQPGPSRNPAPLPPLVLTNVCPANTSAPSQKL